MKATIETRSYSTAWLGLINRAVFLALETKPVKNVVKAGAVQES